MINNTTTTTTVFILYAGTAIEDLAFAENAVSQLRNVQSVLKYRLNRAFLTLYLV